MTDLSFALLLAQSFSLLFLALWLTTGVLDNLRYPAMNETFTAQVLSLSRMAQDEPEAYRMIAHRRITSRPVQRTIFHLAVAWELLTTLALWLAVGFMGAALFGLMEESAARALGLLAALMFTSIWAMFLVVGNYFAYWLCHEGAQTTHYQMALWGLGTMILLAL